MHLSHTFTHADWFHSQAYAQKVPPAVPHSEAVVALLQLVVPVQIVP